MKRLPGGLNSCRRRGRLSGEQYGMGGRRLHNGDCGVVCVDVANWEIVRELELRELRKLESWKKWGDMMENSRIGETDKAIFNGGQTRVSCLAGSSLLPWSFIALRPFCTPALHRKSAAPISRSTTNGPFSCSFERLFLGCIWSRRPFYRGNFGRPRD